MRSVEKLMMVWRYYDINDDMLCCCVDDDNDDGNDDNVFNYNIHILFK